MRILPVKITTVPMRRLPQGVSPLQKSSKIPQPRRSVTPIVIAGIGGINSMGRSGGQNTFFRNVVLDALSGVERQRTMLETLRLREIIRFDSATQKWRHLPDSTLCTTEEVLGRYQERYFDGLSIRELPFGTQIDPAAFEMHFEERDRKHMEVSFAGQLPSGISLDCSTFGPKGNVIPRALRMALFAASDAFYSMGVGYRDLLSISGMHMGLAGLYFGSAMGQVGAAGAEGYMRRYFAMVAQDNATNRGAAFQLPASLINMSSAFIAHYFLGHAGHVSSDVGACATFSYNLYNAVQEIRSGNRLLAMVGAADAALTPPVLTGYGTMKALAKDAGVRDDQGVVHPRRSFNAFGKPRQGFDIGESAQMVILMHPWLAALSGIEPLGMIGDVFVASDGFKESISKVGIGDQLVLSRLVKSLVDDLGIEALRRQSYVSAHGTSTPDNGTSESALLSNMADMAGIDRWPVTAIKGDVAHGLGAAGGDQLAAILGSFALGKIPRIHNLKQTGIADDIQQGHLHFLQDHMDFDPAAMHAAIALQKGFGGCNGGFTVYSPEVAQAFLDQNFAKEQNPKLQDVVVGHREDFERAFLEDHAEIIRYAKEHPGEKRPTDLSDVEFTRDPETGIPTAITIKGMGNSIIL